MGRIGVASMVGIGAGMVAGAQLASFTSTEFVMVFGVVTILMGAFWIYVLLGRFPDG